VRISIFTLLFMLVAALPAAAQVANPGDEARSGAEKMQPPPDQRRDKEGHARRIPSYDQPPIEGGEAPLDGLIEEERFGAYGQPRWTAHRRFGETRVYVVPEGFFELEWWIKPEVPRGGGPTTTVTEFEGELGLGHRLQLDLYLDAQKVGHEDNFELDGQKIELRYALADWDVIPGNPTFYVEYHAHHSGPDQVEMKLLLGGELARAWHWGLNAVFEREIAGDLENNYEATGGISYTVFDTGLGVGAEVKAQFLDNKDRRGNMHEVCLVGPSVQWRPHPAAHIDVVPLFGVTGFSPVFAPTIVIAWEF
jgi:hypothetical protein